MLTVQGWPDNESDAASSNSGPLTGVLPPPKAQSFAETASDWYRRKKSLIVVRHVSDDDVDVLIEIVSAGNKSNKKAFDEFVDKSLDLLQAGVQLLLIDVLPRTKRDRDGIHQAIWENITDAPTQCDGGGQLSTVAYEIIASGVNAYCRTFTVGDALPEMPLFLAEDAQVPVPLESTYMAAFHAVPSRWRRVIEG